MLPGILIMSNISKNEEQLQLATYLALILRGMHQSSLLRKTRATKIGSREVCLKKLIGLFQRYS